MRERPVEAFVEQRMLIFRSGHSPVHCIGIAVTFLVGMGGLVDWSGSMLGLFHGSGSYRSSRVNHEGSCFVGWSCLSGRRQLGTFFSCESLCCTSRTRFWWAVDQSKSADSDRSLCRWFWRLPCF